MVRFHVLAPEIMMWHPLTGEKDRYSIDFETMKVYYDGKITNPAYSVKILDDMVYWGQPSIEEECGIKPAPPGNWHYYGGSYDKARAAYDVYTSWQLDKAFGFEEV